MEKTLNVRDYLDATSDASKRTRVVMLSMVVASVLTFAGFLNSLEHSWMLERVRAMVSSKNPVYFEKKFPNASTEELDGQSGGVGPEKVGGQSGLNQTTIRQKEYELFLYALNESYVNNAYTVRVPFFGITFDVNDLGIVGGVAFIILLVLFRFSLVRELDNLQLSFAEAKKREELPAFYHLLAMRQVLIVPPTKDQEEDHEASTLIRSIPRALSFLPVVVLSIVMANDFITNGYGNAVNSTHTIVSYITTGILWAFVLVTSLDCRKVWRRIDKVWRDHWNEVNRRNIVSLQSKDRGTEQTSAS